MNLLDQQFQYNAWANRRVFEICAAVDPAELDAEAKGTVGTIALTLKHFVHVEDAYVAMIEQTSLDAVGRPETYNTREIPWYGQRSQELSAAYAAIVARADHALLERDLEVPWFQFRLTVGDGLIQVLNHSAQHRAQVLSALGDRGHSVPDIDYVYMLKERAETILSL